ncbi:hypothetical protein C483_00315 [Natrialba hulunbeirensis JCM 10989]|uniref:Uncharacterized protein n=1 Tax=Natrialba hulunbeirensis JCM 10989 TaxID=1227493 RepID=M0AFU5_9EURY|nr:hypothetical protein [Natrialba hulunbeirensis]ELY96223.1 hypothetical protein C483_00315 [Natrialba hulunbeirensis JCM 10989]
MTGAAVAVSGCLSGSENGGSENGVPDLDDDELFEDIFVEGTELVLEFTENSSVEQVNVIDPNGESFAERSIAAGVDRETIEIGTEYEPGDYDVVALEGGDEQTTQSVTIKPDVRITDLRLARNHPDEMFEGASDIDIRTETIISVENLGTGPDEAVRLTFSGDAPRPTPDEYDGSGIYDEESSIRREADSIELPPGEGIILYSQLMPFSASGENASCSPETEEGAFRVILETVVQENSPSKEYGVSFTGEELNDCTIEIEVNS